MLSAMRACTVAAPRMWASAMDAMRLSVIRNRPGAQSALGEFEFRDLAAHLGQPLGHTMLEVKGTEEQHVAASAGAGYLPSERALAARGVIRLVDEAVADARGHLLL